MNQRTIGVSAFALALAMGGPALAQDAPADMDELEVVVRGSPDPVTCGNLTAEGLFADTEVASAAMVAAADGLPAYCEVTATITPVEGSQIGVVYRLPEPEDWNGKVLGLGGGGWMGNVTLEAAADGLSRGYATMQTDGGHPAAGGFDTDWAFLPDGSPNETKIEDFAWRAIHLMTERGKAVAYSHYGEPHDHALYLGCSTGGRMGLMEVQRFPTDYDGVIAGAPVYDLRTQTTQTLRAVAFDGPGGRLLPEHLTLINDAVLAACDAEDGAADGVLRDPRACEWDPAELQCAEGEEAGPSCLTETQVATLNRVYAGETMSDGAIASFPIEKGGEAGWAFFVPAATPGQPATNTGGLHGFRAALLGDAEFDMSEFDADTVETVRSSWMAEVYEAGETDIGEFVDGGGKLILWHGFNDPGPSARATVDYYEAVTENTGEAADAVRLFLAPGVGHCRGGTGPDDIDWLGALDAWVTEGAAPEQIMATKADSDLEWNLCAYPQLPTGQPDGSYACE